MTQNSLQMWELGTIMLVLLAIRLTVYVIQVISLFKVFKKTGEPGWKSFIPFYNDYTLFKRVWSNKELANIYLLTIISAEALSLYEVALQHAGNQENPIITLGSLLIMTAAFVLTLLRNLKESKAFEHGTWFGLGLTFLSPIFNLILGFGKSKYIGPVE